MADIARLAFRIESQEAKTASQNLNAMTAAAGKTSKATDDFDKKQRQASQNSRQLALQLSQVGQQGSITGNYLQALAIQLPDMVVGMSGLTILAVSLAGALGTELFSASNDAEDALSDLKAVTEGVKSSFEQASDGSYELSEELVRLAKVSSEVARLKIDIDTEVARRNVLATGDAIREAFSGIAGDQTLTALEKLNGVTYSDKLAKELGITSDEAERLRAAIAGAQQSTDPENYNELAVVLNDLGGKYTNVYGKVAALRAGLIEQVTTGMEAAEAFQLVTRAGENFDDMLARGIETADEAGQKYKSVVVSLAEQINALRMTEEEQARYNALASLSVDATDAERSAVVALVAEQYRLIAAKQADAEASKLSEEQAQEYADAQKSYARMLQSDIESTYTAVQQITAAYGERNLQLQEMRDADLISDEQYNAGLLANQKSYVAAAARLDAQKQSNDQESLGFYSSIVGNMAQIAAAGNEDQFDAYKRFAQAQALISTYLAATRALAEGGPFVGPILAGTITALGMVQVAQIQAQEYQGSYLGGGYTGSGSRTGGVDGMGGFPAILHPNEAVFDLTRGTGMAVAANDGSSSAPSNITVNNYGNDDVNVRRVNDRDFIVDVMVSEAARNGRGAKAMSRRANGGYRR